MSPFPYVTEPTYAHIPVEDLDRGKQKLNSNPTPIAKLLQQPQSHDSMSWGTDHLDAVRAVFFDCQPPNCIVDQPNSLNCTAIQESFAVVPPENDSDEWVAYPRKEWHRCLQFLPQPEKNDEALRSKIFQVLYRAYELANAHVRGRFRFRIVNDLARYLSPTFTRHALPLMV